MKRYEIYQAPDGWRWRKKGGNGEIISQGEAYASKWNAKRAILTDDPDAVIEYITQPNTQTERTTPS